MKEIRSIIAAYDAIDKDVTNAALATVVRVEGSSYRRTGARMLVMDNGIWVGGISGGCLEGDALKRARMAIAKSVSTLITYDTTEEDSHQIGIGLGCNGVIDVLFTPLVFIDKNNPVEILKSCINKDRKSHVLVSITHLEGEWANLKTGDIIHYSGLQSLSIFLNDLLISEISNAINHQIAENKSATSSFFIGDQKKIELFIEIVNPEISVVIMGHQYDIYPLCNLLKQIGWQTTIIADLQKLKGDIFKIADTVTTPDQISNLLIDQYTAIILMSHDYKTDKKNLPIALATAATYIGMLGPRSRSEKIRKELAEEGKPISAAALDRIHAPVGLDIGAITPDEIALSLVAEIRASLSGREGGFLRLRKTSIHERG
jgi:xanthine/CO dehydrogenase XdhC/CoxF family maturation factor